MSAQENKEKARRMLEEAFGQGKLEVVEEVLDLTSSATIPTPRPGR